MISTSYEKYFPNVSLYSFDSAGLLTVKILNSSTTTSNVTIVNDNIYLISDPTYLLSWNVES